MGSAAEFFAMLGNVLSKSKGFFFPKFVLSNHFQNQAVHCKVTATERKYLENVLHI